jgi:heme oxygenase
MKEIPGEPPKAFVCPDSAALRTKTQSSHDQVEQALALPGAIANMDDYRRWLSRFLGFYEPLEAILSSFHGWTDWGIDLSDMGHKVSLRKDIAAMQTEPRLIPKAQQDSLPKLLTFAEAFGALYVVEGSKLGGKFILREIATRLGPELKGADSFFTGNGEAAGARWNAFKQSLDRFLLANSAQFPLVVAGAESTFSSIQAWMSPLNLAAQR